MPALWIAVAVVLAWFAVEGFRHGVVRRLVELIGLVVIFLFASRLAGDIEPVLSDSWGLSPKVAFFSAWILVIVVGVVSVRLLAAGSQKLVRFSIAGWLDRVGGIVLGAIFGGVVASCLLIVLIALPVDDDLRDGVREDPALGVVLRFAPNVYDFVRQAWDGERFFEMVREHVEPAAEKAAESIRAVVEDLDRDSADQ